MRGCLGSERLADHQWPAEALFYEVVARDFPLRITRPQVDVRLPVGVVKHLSIREVALQMEVVEQLLQCNDGIAVSVVQGVVEIQEKVFVFHVVFIFLPAKLLILRQIY